MLQSTSPLYSNRKGLEKAADFVLKPTRYLFYGKEVTLFENGDRTAILSHRNPSFVKTALAISLLVPSLTFGTILKVFSQFFVGKKIGFPVPNSTPTVPEIPSPVHPKTSVERPTGLANRGNTCFFNSTLQAIDCFLINITAHLSRKVLKCPMTKL